METRASPCKSFEKLGEIVVSSSKPNWFVVSSTRRQVYDMHRNRVYDVVVCNM